MKKILFFIPTLDGGGAEKVLINLVNNMDLHKYMITVQTLFDYGINRKFLRKEINYKYVFKKIFRGNKHILKLFSPEFLFKKMIKEEYDIIISFCEGVTTRVVAGCNNKKTKIINWVHNEEKTYISSCFRNVKEMMKYLQKYDKNIFVAETALQSFNELTNNKIKNSIVIRNAIDTDDILKKAKENPNIKKKYFTIIAMGRLAKSKGFERLIKIHKNLLNNGFKHELWILGEGPERKNLEKLIKQLDLKETTRLLGYNENPYCILNLADIFVCSSYVEGYSTATIEALILEKPIVTMNCSGMNEILENGKDGIIANNEEELYTGIVNMMTKQNIRNKYINKEKERKKYFGIENNVRIIEKQFNSL